MQKVGIQSWICFCVVAFLHFAFGCLGSSKHCCRVPKHRLILSPVHLDVSSVAWHIQQWTAWTYAMVCLLRLSFASKWDFQVRPYMGSMDPAASMRFPKIQTILIIYINLYNMEFKLFVYFMESTGSDFFISGRKFNRGTLCPLLIGAMGWWRQASVCSAKGRIRGHLKQNLFNKAPFTSVPLSFWWSSPSWDKWNRKDKEQTHEIHEWIHDDLWTSCTLLLWPPFGPNNKRGDPSPRESERARDGDFAQTLEYVTTGAAAFHCLVFIQYTPAKTFNKQTWQCCPNTNG